MKNNNKNILLFGLNKTQTATSIAIVFHLIGLMGIIFFDRSLFVKTSAINLLLMLGLIFYTQDKINRTFVLFFGLTFSLGILIEIIGTKTGYLFGSYSYGNVLGPAIENVPVIIGVNWFIVMFCCGTSIHLFIQILIKKLTDVPVNPFIKKLSLMVDGAILALIFDWMMEPVAVKLGYWSWNEGGCIPLYNYVCWFMTSVFFLWLFQRLDFNKDNKFAVNLLMIQTMFFLILRTFL